MKNTSKRVLDVRTVNKGHWVGDGFPVRTLFSYDDPADLVSPFLLLDYAGPAEFPPSQKRHGVGEHPHRGFETVTIIYSGEVVHRDSAGHGGHIGPGDVQWMTAASGVVHEEMHGDDFTRNGGTLEMVQLWVNLPAKFKMSKPKYQDILSASIPVVDVGGAGKARIIAGELETKKGPASTFTPINLWDLTLQADRPMPLSIPEGHTAMVFVRRGEAQVGGEKAGEGSVIFLSRDGREVTLKSSAGASLLLLSGEPIEEKVVGYGPFVMNSEDEIRQAAEDYRAGRMGHL